MRTNINFAIAILLAALIVSPPSNAEETQVLPFSDSEMYEMLKPALKSRDIWFEDLGENRIRVKTSDIGLVFQVAEEEIVGIIPKGRSASLEKNIHDEVVSRLESEQIPFTTQCFDSSLWIVWEEQYTQHIERIIEESAIKMYPTNTGEFEKCA
jgi:hypothetical protein